MQNWKRTYWAVWVANFITATGMMSFLPFFPRHLESLGLTERSDIELWTGLVFGAAPLAAAVMTPVWGALGDRIGRKAMVARAMFAITIFVGGMSFVTTPQGLFFMRLGQGVFSGFVAPSITLVSVSAPADKQGRITGSLQTAIALGAVIGPLLGGILAADVGMGVIFRVVAVAAALGALLVLFLAKEDAGARQKVSRLERTPRALLQAAVSDLKAAFAIRELRGVVVFLFFLQFGMGITNPLMELFVRDVLGGDSPDVARVTGSLFSSMALINLFAMPWWGSYGDKVGHSKALGLCSLLASLALGLHAIVPTIALLFIVRMFLGAGMAGASPCAYGLAATELPVERRGGGMGLVFSSRTLALSLSAMCGGWLSEWVGIRGLFVVGALVILFGLKGLSASRRPLVDKA
jgi:DHA1 family multidrug resistance protein-like MFS transporter